MYAVFFQQKIRQVIVSSCLKTRHSLFLVSHTSSFSKAPHASVFVVVGVREHVARQQDGDAMNMPVIHVAVDTYLACFLASWLSCSSWYWLRSGEAMWVRVKVCVSKGAVGALGMLPYMMSVRMVTLCPWPVRSPQA